MRPHTERFSASAPGSPYILTIANGPRDETPAGRDRPPVQSAEIRLNGELVPGTEKISQTVRYLKIPVTVQAQNTVDVKVAGPQGAMLNIGIGPAPSADSQATGEK